MASKRHLKKLVKMSSKYSVANYVFFTIKDESEEDGNKCMWHPEDIKFSKFCMVYYFKSTPMVAVPYWKIQNAHIKSFHSIFEGLHLY